MKVADKQKEIKKLQYPKRIIDTIAFIINEKGIIKEDEDVNNWQLVYRILLK